ncbi:MAG: DUF523 domain-containing protein [Bacilli bacterium]|nr:DUF523 domain-containing protein [Bacilli bacterium]
MRKILISACLIGDKCNYKGQSNFTPKFQELAEKGYELVPFCPEVEGGLPTPRLPNEIRNSQVVRSDGKDVTREFESGAKKALMLCDLLGIKIAILKEASPSCGTHEVHDGHFQGRKIPGLGWTARKLKEKGIEVYSENEIDKILEK